jgi:hypothetical protein
VNVSKNVKPEFIEEPYGGACPSFYDKKVEEDRWLEQSESDEL